MNKKLLTLYTLCAALLFTASSCKKETAGVTETCRTVSQYTIIGTTPYYTTYHYDSKGRIDATLGSQLYSFITYTADSAFYKEYQLNGFLNSSFSMKLDASGRFITRGGITYQYDTEGHLIKEVVGSVIHDYTWQDGNMTSETTTISGVPSYTYTYTYYTDKENKAHWDYNHNGIDCFFGEASKNLLKHISTEDLVSGTVTETNWTYEYNEKGLPTQMTILFVGTGTFNTYFYTYECN